MLTAQQIGPQRRDPGPVTGRRTRLGREHRRGHRPATTYALLGTVLDRDQSDRREVEDLANLLTGHRRPTQVTTTRPARLRRVRHDLVRIRPCLQPRTPITWLPARFTTRLTTQRPRRRFHERIRRRWFRGVLRVLAQPGLQ